MYIKWCSRFTEYAVDINLRRNILPGLITFAANASFPISESSSFCVHFLRVSHDGSIVVRVSIFS